MPISSRTESPSRHVRAIRTYRPASPVMRCEALLTLTVSSSHQPGMRRYSGKSAGLSADSVKSTRPENG